MLTSTNIKTCLEKVRDKRISSTEEGFINKSGQLGQENTKGLSREKLEGSKIFHEQDIKKLCIDYRLRFLDFTLYKGSIPSEAIDKIIALEKEHNTEISQLKLVAPSGFFRLKNADDPLLFTDLGNDYYYLIHKWGKDLHPLRRLMMWPYKSLENLIFTVLLISVLFTFIVPEGLFSKEQSFNQSFIVFLFMFKWVAAVVLYYGIALGKNFNNEMWNSKYFNA